MVTITKQKKIQQVDLNELKFKADLFDEVMEVMEDKCLGYLMKSVENEPDVPLAKARKIMCS